MSWKKRVASCTLLLTSLAGCARQVYLSEAAAQNMLVGGRLPDAEELKPHAINEPLPGHDISAKNWATVLDPDRDIRYMSLSEAIAIALEQGHEGAGLSGTDSLGGGSLSFGGAIGGLTSDDSIRALSVEPAIQAASIDAALSKFDVRFATSMNWTTTDRPVGTPIDQFQAAGGINGISTQDATSTTSLIKPLPTGGTAGITYTIPYELTNLPSRVSPSYRPDVNFSFEQPLLKGCGVDINQLNLAHPGSTLTPFNGAITNASAGIIISRIRFDQQRAEFERHVHAMLVNVEVAYWNLYAQYWTLYSQEAALRQAWEAWKIARSKAAAGLQTEADLEQARAQYEAFRGSRLDALYSVLENERILRSLLGLPIADGTRLVPSDTPTLAGYRPDPELAAQQALALRPELVEAREDLKFRQLDMKRATNDYLPDLRLLAQYGINGIGNRLDGSSPDNALKNQFSNHFNNWLLGINLNVPLGMRDAAAGERIARLHLAQSLMIVQSLEEKAVHYAAQQYGQVLKNYAQIGIKRSRREALSKEVQARFQRWQAGKDTLDLLLEAQRNWASALNDETLAIRDYNNSLILFEYAKGTIMVHDNVTIAEGALPSCVAQRAADHAREQNAALVLRERAHPLMHGTSSPESGQAGLPEMPADGSAVSLPALMEKAPRVGKEIPDHLEPMPTAGQDARGVIPASRSTILPSDDRGSAAKTLFHPPSTPPARPVQPMTEGEPRMKLDPVPMPTTFAPASSKPDKLDDMFSAPPK